MAEGGYKLITGGDYHYTTTAAAAAIATATATAVIMFTFIPAQVFLRLLPPPPVLAGTATSFLLLIAYYDTLALLLLSLLLCDPEDLSYPQLLSTNHPMLLINQRYLKLASELAGGELSLAQLIETWSTVLGKSTTEISP